MKILANENIPIASVNLLISLGYDVLSIGLNCPSISDKEVMEIAIKENRTIITFDRDYSELIFKWGYKPYNGVIYLRLEEYNPSFPGEIIHDLINNHEIDFLLKLTVVDKNGIRQRKY